MDILGHYHPFYSCNSLVAYAVLFSLDIYIYLYHYCIPVSRYFFLSHFLLSSAIVCVLAFLYFLFPVLFFLLILLGFFTYFFHLDLLILSILFLFSLLFLVLGICCVGTSEIMVSLWLLFVCSANTFLATLLVTIHIMLKHHCLILYFLLADCVLDSTIIKLLYDNDIIASISSNSPILNKRLLFWEDNSRFFLKAPALRWSWLNCQIFFNFLSWSHFL